METSTEAFIEFVETDPGLARWIIAIYRRIDDKALQCSSDLLRNRDLAWLRARAADQSISADARARNQARVDAIEQDPTGRLAVIPDLRAWAFKSGGSICNTHINWYRVRVEAWIAAHKTTLVPMMVERGGMQVAR